MKTRIIDEITKFVFVKDEIEESDIIFIPGGSHPELGEGAAELYKKGLAKKVMPSGGFSVKTGKFNGVKSKKEIYCKDYLTEYEFLEDVLQVNGVPNSVIIREDKAGTTRENAYFSRQVADENGIVIKKAIICCKNFHARRSLMFYQFAFPDTEFFIYPVPYYQNGVNISAENWYKSEDGIKRVLGEIQRYGTQFDEEFANILNKGL